MSEIHTAKNLDNKIKLGLVLNFGFTLFEFGVGIFSGSLALISDAGHNLSDSLSLVIAFFGNKVAKREANEEHTYGYGRATIITALINALLLLGLSIFIFYEAYKRILNPEPVEGFLVAIVALIGMTMNVGVAFLFRNEKQDLNIRSAYINMLFDALASGGALLAGILIVVTKLTIFDSLISIIIGLLLIRSGWSLVKKALHVLLEGVPEGINMEKVKKAIINHNAMIKAVDDLHIWAISSQYAALSCHVVIEDCDLEKSTRLVKQIKEELHQKFNIEHATIETELVECPPEKA